MWRGRPPTWCSSTIICRPLSPPYRWVVARSSQRTTLSHLPPHRQSAAELVLFADGGERRVSRWRSGCCRSLPSTLAPTPCPRSPSACCRSPPSGCWTISPSREVCSCTVAVRAFGVLGPAEAVVELSIFVAALAAAVGPGAPGCNGPPATPSSPRLGRGLPHRRRDAMC